MSDYRDELRAAHERIAQLEAERKPKAPKRPRSRLPLVFAVVSVLGIFGGMGVFYLRAAHPIDELPRSGELPPPLDETPPPDLAPLLGMSWYSQPLVTPVFADIDLPEDGTREIIGLAWNANADHEDAPLSLVALDRETGRARWHAGPYPAHWASDRVHLLKVGDQLVVSDSHAALHVLDFRTGSPIRVIPLTMSPDHMCPVHDGTARVLVNEGYEPNTTLAVDLVTGAIAKAGPKLPCETFHEDHSCVPDVYSSWCTLPTDRNVDARIQSSSGMKNFHSSELLTSGSDLVAIGFLQASEGRGSEVAVGLERSTTKAIWTEGLVAPDDVLDSHVTHGVSPQTLLVNEHLYYLYESGKEPLPYRLVSRAAKTGDLVFEEDVPRTAEGSYMTSLSEDAGQIFVIMDQTIHIFNGATGAHVRRISSF